MSSSTSREIILASSGEGPITAYDASTGAPLACFSGIRSPRKGITLAGRSFIAASHISSATASGSICLYSWCSLAAFRLVATPEPVAPLVSTSEGQYLFSGGLSGSIHAFSVPSGDLLRSFAAHHKPVSCLAVTDDSSLLISGGDDGSVAIFPIFQILDASSEGNSVVPPLHRLQAHNSSVTAVIAGTGGINSTIISCSMDCTCKLWSLGHGQHLRTVQFPTVIWCVAVDVTETEFYAGGADGRIYRVLMKVGRRAASSSELGAVAWAPEHAGAVVALALANHGQSLISASEDGTIRIWDAGRGTVVRVLGEGNGSIADLVVAKGGGGNGGGGRNGDGLLEGEGSGFSMREISSRSVKEIAEMEEWLDVVARDRRRAIDTLEVAIRTYERLLGLFLNLNQGKGG